VLSVNPELIPLYWNIGGDPPNRQRKEGCGTKVIDRLSDDLSVSGNAWFSAQESKIDPSPCRSVPGSTIHETCCCTIDPGAPSTNFDTVKDTTRSERCTRQGSRRPPCHRAVTRLHWRCLRVNAAKKGRTVEGSLRGNCDSRRSQYREYCRT